MKTSLRTTAPIWNTFKYEENFKNMNITFYTLNDSQEIMEVRKLD